MQPTKIEKLPDGKDRIVPDGTELFKIEGEYLTSAQVAKKYGLDAATWKPLKDEKQTG